MQNQNDFSETVAQKTPQSIHSVKNDMRIIAKLPKHVSVDDDLPRYFGGSYQSSLSLDWEKVKIENLKEKSRLVKMAIGDALRCIGYAFNRGNESVYIALNEPRYPHFGFLVLNKNLDGEPFLYLTDEETSFAAVFVTFVEE